MEKMANSPMGFLDGEDLFYQGVFSHGKWNTPFSVNIVGIPPANSAVAVDG